MFKIRQFISIVIFCFLIVKQTLASELAEKALYDFLNSYDNTNILFSNALSSSAKLLETCKEKYRIPIGEIYLIDQPEFDAVTNQLKNGKFRESYKVRRCNTDLVFNIFTIFHDGELRHVFSVIGDSIVPYNAINDAVKFAYNNVLNVFRANAVECPSDEFVQSAVVSDTKILSDLTKVLVRTPSDFFHNKFYNASIPIFGEEILNNAQWIEEWTIKACSHSVKLKIQMKMQDDGIFLLNLLESNYIKE